MNINVEPNASELAELRGLLDLHRPGGYPFDVESFGLKAPPPIVAIKNKKVIGGVSFIWHPILNDGEIGLWITELFIAPEHRNNGYGTALVTAAMENRLPKQGLIIFTTTPKIFESCGWSFLISEPEYHLMKFEEN